MSTTTAHKQGDSFTRLLAIPAEFADGYFTGWTVKSQVRTEAGDLLSDCASSVTVPSLKSDTPASGVIRIAGDRYTYSGKSGSNLTGLSPAIKVGGYSGAAAFVPLIDGTASGPTMSSAAFQFSTPFTCRYRVRNGAGGSAIVPFESTLSVTETGGSGTAVRNADE